MALSDRFAIAVEKSWYQPLGWTWLLWPLSLLFRLFTQGKYQPKRSQLDAQIPLPVIVIGNLSVGGTGKTPLIISLVKALQKAGMKPCVVSRGYGGKAIEYPYRITEQSTAREAGDEPLLIAAYCPVAVAPERIQAVDLLLKETDCNVILSDDGLQHYKLPRDIEVVVVDGERGLGNGLCLPAGPLREPESRLASVDLVVVNQGGNKSVNKQGYKGAASDSSQPGFASRYIPQQRILSSAVSPVGFRRLLDNEIRPLDGLPIGQVNAVAGIGNPQRFVKTLQSLGFSPILHQYPDHYAYTGKELVFDDELPVIVTAKDAIKFDQRVLEKITDPEAAGNIWILDVEAVPEEALFTEILAKIARLSEGAQPS